MRPFVDHVAQQVADGCEIEVIPHCVDRARQRRHMTGGHRAIAEKIIDQVRDAIRAGRVSTRKPVWAQQFTLDELRGRKLRPERLRPGQVFVWDAHERLGWIVQTGAGKLTVKTAMHRVRSEPQQAVAA